MWWKNAKLNACILITIIGEALCPADSLTCAVRFAVLRNSALIY
jgi:hypothetical protein